MLRCVFITYEKKGHDPLMIHMAPLVNHITSPLRDTNIT